MNNRYSTRSSATSRVSPPTATSCRGGDARARGLRARPWHPAHRRGARAPERRGRGDRRRGIPRPRWRVRGGPRRSPPARFAAGIVAPVAPARQKKHHAGTRRGQRAGRAGLDRATQDQLGQSGCWVDVIGYSHLDDGPGQPARPGGHTRRALPFAARLPPPRRHTSAVAPAGPARVIRSRVPRIRGSTSISLGS
jgi:hypothetical protein